MRQRLRETVHAQVLADDPITARQITRLTAQMQVVDLRTNRSSWQAMQDLVSDIELPIQGYVCLVDRSNGEVPRHLGSLRFLRLFGLKRKRTHGPGGTRPLEV